MFFVCNFYTSCLTFKLCQNRVQRECPSLVTCKKVTTQCHKLVNQANFPFSIQMIFHHLSDHIPITWVFFSSPFIRNTRSISMELGPVLHREMDFWEVRLIIQNHRKQYTTVEINKLI